jgi:hypothetical protein
MRPQIPTAESAGSSLVYPQQSQVVGQVAGLQNARDVTIQMQIVDIVAGSIFLFIGLATAAVVTLGRRSGVRVFVWLSIWSAMYGVVHLSQTTALLETLPERIQVVAHWGNAALTFLLPAPVFRGARKTVIPA